MSIFGLRYLEGVVTLAFDASACTGCGRCLEVCPHAVFERAEGTRGPVALRDRDACMECGACAGNCQDGAITVRAGVGCAPGIRAGLAAGTEPTCDCGSGGGVLLMPSGWIEQSLQGAPGLAPLFAALVLGLLGAATSCCSFALIGGVAGYSGSRREAPDRRGILLAGGAFLAGSVIALALIGAVTGFVSQAAGAALGRYWKLFAGLLIVLFGLASLGLVPFRLPRVDLGRALSASSGAGPALAYGLAIGGGATACSTVCCSPVLALLGYATLKGGAGWGAVLLGTYALGFSIPIAAGFVGLSLGLGQLTTVARRVAPAVQRLAGVAMIGVGFYLLATL